ncbi:MAG: hypothetical protein K8S99_18690 [Planctomycetes bacterium]|nr:hypothetical protein [Planctomycetota bacterium]
MAESNRLITGQALKFAGLVLTVGGSLAIFRTRGVESSWFNDRPWFFLLLIPLGLVTWFVGFRLCAAAAPPSDREAKPRG